MGEQGESVHTRHLMLVEAESTPLQTEKGILMKEMAMSNSETEEGDMFYDAVEAIEEFHDAMDEYQLAEKLTLDGRSQMVEVMISADDKQPDSRSHTLGVKIQGVNDNTSQASIMEANLRQYETAAISRSQRQWPIDGDQIQWNSNITHQDNNKVATECHTQQWEPGEVPDDTAQPVIKMVNTERENTYYIKSRFDRSSHMLLLDTGCSHSVMPYHLYTTLSLKCKIKYNPIHNRGILANGSNVSIHGIAETQFKIGTTTYIHDFQLADIDGKILLGMDFFRKHRCVINVHRYTVQIGDQILDCCDIDGDPLIIGVQAKRATVIPPQSQKMIEARMTRHTDRLVEGIVEPRHQVVGLMVATSLHRPDGAHLNIRVLNATDEDIQKPVPEGWLYNQEYFVHIEI